MDQKCPPPPPSPSQIRGYAYCAPSASAAFNGVYELSLSAGVLTGFVKVVIRPFLTLNWVSINIFSLILQFSISDFYFITPFFSTDAFF